MNLWNKLAAFLAAATVAFATATARAEGDGQEELDEALRVKVTAENLRDINKVIELLETAIQEGLDVENSDFAERLLSETLMERASQLAAVVQSVPLERLADPQLQRVRDLAVTDLQRVLEYDEAPVHAKVLLAQLQALPGGEKAEALKLLNEAFEAEQFQELPAKMRAEAISLRATLQEDPEKALQDFDEAIALEPEEDEHRLARADFNRQRGKLDEALQDIEELLKQDEENAGALLVKAQILREQEKLDEAIAVLDKATEIAPSAPGPYQERGEIYRIQGEAEKAIDQFNRVLQLQPGFMLTLIHRAEAYIAEEEYEEALVDIEAILKENPTLAVAHALRAQALANLDRLPEAIEAMEKLADATPEQPEFRMQLAFYYLYNKQAREAIQQYGKVLEQLEGEEGEDAERVRFQALRGRADAQLNIGEHRAAVKDFDAAMKIDDEDASVLNNFAWVLATSPDEEVRDGKRAVELATKAVELTDETQAHILSTLAAAYAETGDFEAARKWSQKSVDLNDPEHLDQLKKELASYQENKPWRERQTGEEGPEGSEQKVEPAQEAEKPADDSETKPATAEKPVSL
ncbi:MAG TPA: tetratricopeptide repeat protein [Lacipirellula sp.]